MAEIQKSAVQLEAEARAAALAAAAKSTKPIVIPVHVAHQPTIDAARASQVAAENTNAFGR